MKVVKVDEDGGIPLEAFADFVDITQVHSYRIEDAYDGDYIITFYDVNGDLLKGKK